VKFKLSKLPTELKWGNIIGVGFLGGIGFTMSIFITLLAYTDMDMANNAKISILIGSVVAAIIGLVWLKIMLVKPVEDED